MSLSEWERHTGSRKKNWKMSVKLKITGEPLITLVSPQDLHQIESSQSNMICGCLYTPTFFLIKRHEKTDTWFVLCHYLQLDDIPGGNFKSFTPSIKKEELLQLQGTLALEFVLGCVVVAT